MCLEIVCETKDGLVLLLLGSPLVALGISAMIAFVWKKRKKSEAGTSDTQQEWWSDSMTHKKRFEGFNL